MSNQSNPMRFLLQEGTVDFTAPVPVEFLLSSFPARHDPTGRLELFRLSTNWTVRVHESLAEVLSSGETLDSGAPFTPFALQFYHQGKGISILTPIEREELRWELFRQGDALFQLDGYQGVKRCVRERHGVRVPPWGVIERFVHRFCPWSANTPS